MLKDAKDAAFMRRGEDLQDFLLTLLKRGLNKQARDMLGLAAAQYVKNECVANNIVEPDGPQLEHADLQVLESLRQQGFFVLDPLLSPIDIDAIERAMAPKHIQFSEEGFDGTPDKKVVFDDRPADARFGHYALHDILSCPEFYRLINNERLIKIVASYLQAPPTISTVGMWWSLPSANAPKGMQQYHHDRGDFRSCNLFVYLTDVTETTGPHSFVSHTHEMSVLHPLAHQRYKHDSQMYGAFWQWMEVHRKSDEDVRKFFTDDEIKVFTGPRGTNFLEDTRGIHKATVPTSGPRLVFEIVYSTLPKFNETVKPVSRESLDFDTPSNGNEQLNPLVQYATRLMYQ